MGGTDDGAERSRTDSPPTTPPDAEVVARVRAGETALFELLMRRHNQRVYRAVRAILRNEDEVEEVMQAAYVSAYAHLDQFEGRARVSTWLVRIAVNEALGHLRRRKRVVALADFARGSAEMPTTPTFEHPSSDPERHAADRELVSIVEAAFDRLPETYRTVLMLRQIEGMDTAETAAALGIGQDATKQRLHRARAMLRREIEGRIGRSAARAFEFGADRCDRVVTRVLARIEGEQEGGRDGRR